MNEGHPSLEEVNEMRTCVRCMACSFNQACIGKVKCLIRIHDKLLKVEVYNVNIMTFIYMHDVITKSIYLLRTMLCHGSFVMPYPQPCFVIIHWGYIYVCGFDQGCSLSLSLSYA